MADGTKHPIDTLYKDTRPGGGDWGNHPPVNSETNTGDGRKSTKPKVRTSRGVSWLQKIKGQSPKDVIDEWNEN